MKRIFLILSLFVFLIIASPVRGMGFFEELFEAIDLKEESQDSSIFSDPGYTQPTHNFSLGQMVYIRVESMVSGEKEKTLRVLDSEKREIQKSSLNQKGNIFTTSFAASSISGVYYVDVKIEDSGGSKFASQENINVGQGQGPTTVSSEAESVVVKDEQTSLTVSPTATPQPEAGPPLVEAHQSLVTRLINFFKRLFSLLTSL